MEKIDGEQLKKIQLEILDVVTQFCDTNGIRYWLDSGTLLGAIRHKGYNPVGRRYRSRNVAGGLRAVRFGFQ